MFIHCMIVLSFLYIGFKKLATNFDMDTILNAFFLSVNILLLLFIVGFLMTLTPERVDEFLKKHPNIVTITMAGYFLMASIRLLKDFRKTKKL